MYEFTSSPLFGISLCIFTFAIGLWINKKLKSPLANPLLIAIAFIIIILNVFKIPLEDFNQGGDIISMFLAPATVALALSIYRQFEILKRNFLPIFLGCLSGAVASMVSSFLLCKAFGLDEQIIASVLPKSVTTPIAMEISSQLGGIVPVTIVAVIISGITGAVFAPFLIKLFKVNDPVIAGVSIGACSHALGTSKAVELGEIQGAMSGIALSISGIITVILSLFL